MPRRRPSSLAMGILFALASVQACGGPTATPVPTRTAVDASPSPSADPPPTEALPSAEGGTSATPLPPTEPSLASRSHLGMPISLELTADCGLCGPTSWLYGLPRFRLYADGTAVFRGPGEDWPTAPYRFVQLGDRDFEDLLMSALDDGGMRGAAGRYPGDWDDAGEIRLALHAPFVDPAADVDVVIEPVSADATTDRFGDPIEDRPRRERLEAFAATLADFDAWLASRGEASEPFLPESYTAAILDRYHMEAATPWPWDDLAPTAFGSAGPGVALARITPSQASAAGSGLGGAELSTVPFGDDVAGALVIRPILPGDDRPGMFGLRSDMAAITVEPDLRVRSLPEVSDASAKLSPLLRDGDTLYVIDGPVAGSGYDWYEVHAPRAGLTGWVAAASKEDEEWIRAAPMTCDGDDPRVDLSGGEVDLMTLACYRDVELSGVRLLAHPADDGLRCPDTFEWVRLPDWLDVPLMCGYEFRQELEETGGGDLISAGVLHPSIANVPRELLEAQPGGLLVEVRGRYDHPDTRECTAEGENMPPPALVRLGCRATFVITAMEPAA